MYLGNFDIAIFRLAFFFQFNIYVRRGREQMRTSENGPIGHKVFLKWNNKLFTVIFWF